MSSKYALYEASTGLIIDEDSTDKMLYATEQSSIKGFGLVIKNPQSAVVFGGFADGVVGGQGVGVIDFLVSGQNEDELV